MRVSYARSIRKTAPGNTRVDGRTAAGRHSRLVRPATVLAWICLVAAAAPTVSEAQEADIPDENLRAAIEDALGKRSGEAITVEEMESLTELRSQYANIEDLTGLEHATGLTELHLAYNDIVDLAPLSDLASLEVLRIPHNSISDLAPLAGSDLVASLRVLGLLQRHLGPVAAVGPDLVMEP